MKKFKSMNTSRSKQGNHRKSLSSAKNGPQQTMDNDHLNNSTALHDLGSMTQGDEHPFETQ